MHVQGSAAVVDGHVAAATRVFDVGEELGHGIGEGEAALHQEADFTVLGEAYVLDGQGRGGADCDSFL
jgi:hypothetical protein